MRKITGNKKGIDTILAALLMVVIVVVAAVMVYAWSTGLLGTLLVNPNNNKEGPLYADNAVVCSTANCNFVTINIRNAGNLAVQFNSYYVTDNAGNQWAKLNYNNQTQIAPNQVVSFVFYIGSTSGPCASNGCTYTGASGTFASGTWATGGYTVKVVTSRNNPFPFTFTK